MRHWCWSSRGSPYTQRVYRVPGHVSDRSKLSIKKKPNGITKAHREAMKADDLLIWKPYVSAIFDCFDLGVFGLVMGTCMKAGLYVHTLEKAPTTYSPLEGTIIHCDRGNAVYQRGIPKGYSRLSLPPKHKQCRWPGQDNVRFESMCARMKTEIPYDRYDTKQMTAEELKELIWKYFPSYWNNWRIWSANGGLLPMIKRGQYCKNLELP